MRPPVSLLLLFAGIALFTTGCKQLQLSRRAETARAIVWRPRIGPLAPETDGETFGGQRMKLSDHKGKVVLVVFWYSGCVPCMEMVEHERELAQRYRDKPF